MPVGLTHSIRFKLFSVLLAAIVPVVALTTWLVWYSIGQGFLNYVRSVELVGAKPAVAALERVYEKNGNWDFLPRDPAHYNDWWRLNGPGPRQPPGGQPQNAGGPPPYGAGGPPGNGAPPRWDYSFQGGPPNGGPPNGGPPPRNWGPPPNGGPMQGGYPPGPPGAQQYGGPQYGGPQPWDMQPRAGNEGAAQNLAQQGRPPQGGEFRGTAGQGFAPQGSFDAPPPPQQAGGPPPGGNGGPPGMMPRGDDRLDIGPRLAVLDKDGNLLAGPPAALQNTARLPVLYRGSTVGFVALAPAGTAGPEVEQRFLSDQRRNLASIGVLAVALSALLGWLAARHFIRPIQVLAAATRKLSAGAYDTRLDESRQDEFGDLARSFNQMGASLAEHAEMQRQWVADTSHELRTPIAVLRAQVEALQDGIHSPDEATLDVLHGEVMGLTKLVDDLYLLARSDAGGLKLECVPADPVAIIHDVVENFEARLSSAGLSAKVVGAPDKPWITLGDPDRLRQVFKNLVENSIRYTDAGGRLEISVQAKPNTMVLRFEDTAPGVPEADLPRLFERFFRVDSSRNREKGGSGLGLSICRNIIEGHGGTMTASASPLGGLRMEIVIPKRDNAKQEGKTS